MSVNDLKGIIPFAEMIERIMSIGKTDSFNYGDYIRSLANDIYTRDLPRQWDWNPIISESSFLTAAPYNLGSISVAAESTSVTGAGTAWTSGMTADNGWKIKFSANDIIYAFTYTSPTTATISPALSGATNLTSCPYTLFKDEYQLALDFDRLLRNGSVYAYIGGRLQLDPIEEVPRDQFRTEYFPSAVDPIRRIMLIGTHPTTGAQMVRVNPWPYSAKLYPYEYVRKISPMTQYTTGTVSAVYGDATVTGVGTVWTTNLVAGMYFRIDSIGIGDSSKWYKILSVTDNTHIELTETYADDSVVGEAYTACSAPTAFPSKFHEYIVYEAVARVLATQDDPALKSILGIKADILNGLYKDYKGRRTNTAFAIDDGGYRRS